MTMPQACNETKTKNCGKIWLTTCLKDYSSHYYELVLGNKTVIVEVK